MATGREANFKELDCHLANINVSKKEVLVDENFKTSNSDVYAIGDVNRRWMLAHVATYQGYHVIDDLLEKPSNINFDVVPSSVFIHPEISSVGLTEEEVKEKYGKGNYKTHKTLFKGIGKAVAMKEEEGFTKVICDLEGKVLGIHILGAHSSDIIHQGSLIIGKNMGIEEVNRLIFSHPTLSECLSHTFLELD